MIVGYIEDDGGRAAAGYSGHTGDCVVRAIAILTGQKYAEIYALMTRAMKQAGYRASGDGYRQTARPGFKPRLSARQVQNLVKHAYGLHRIPLGPGPKPTYTQAWILHGNCLVGTTKHVSAIVDAALRDTFDHRIYDATLYGRSPEEQRKAQSVWLRDPLASRAANGPVIDPLPSIPPPRRRAR